MARTPQIPRARGALSGLFLIVLGAWGGLIPLVGPYATFGFTPDKTWDLTQGRLYLSVVPGAVTLLAGLVIMFTRSRGFGGFWAFASALAGFWFIAGAAVVQLLPASLGTSISTGTPIGTTSSQVIVTALAFYAGTGALILFFSAIALGRFAVSPVREHARVAQDLAGGAGVAGLAGAGALGYDAYQSGQPGQSYSPVQPYSPVQSQFPAGQDTYGETQTAYPQSPEAFQQSHDTFPQTQEAFGAGTGSGAEQYPTTTNMYPGGQAPYPGSNPEPYVGSQDPFPGNPNPYSPGQ